MSIDLYRSDRTLRFDEGITAQSADSIDLERELRFANGSGDDIADSVAWALDFEEIIGHEAINEFDDPLDILIAEEDDEL